MDPDTIAIHFTSDDHEDWQQTLNNVSNLYQEAAGDAAVSNLVLVVNGPAIRFLLNSGREAGRVRQMLEGGISIGVCENSLERFNYDADQLVSGIDTVPSGVAEMVRLQQAGATYLKLP
jgi:intracellular sulfur oxidation DsrE/DsrF family protein